MYSDDDDAWELDPGEEFGGVDRASWDEDDWGAYFDRQDVLDAKYQELFETLRDHPDCEELIAHEMHWSLPEDSVDPCCPLDEVEDEDALCSHHSFADDLATIPAYSLVHEFALQVERQLTARLRDGVDADEDSSRAIGAAIDVSSQVASGHSIGYERDTLCGNIACCNRALRSLAECFDGILALRRRGVLPFGEADELLSAGRAASDAVAQRVAELRGRVWWC